MVFYLETCQGGEQAAEPAHRLLDILATAAGDSFPQGGCQQLSWGTLRLSVPAVWSEVLGDSENLCKWSPHWAGCGESRKVLHVGPGHSLVPLPSLSLLERLHSHEFTDPVM